MRLLAFIPLLLATTSYAQQYTPYQFELGRKLFHDPRLSVDGTVSCATCHNPETGFTDNLQVAKGIQGRLGTMNTPTILTSFDDPLQFWNGRVNGVRSQNGRTIMAIEMQALQPLQNPDEMGDQELFQVVDRINSIAGYRALFRKAYGGLANERRLGHAIAAFQSTCSASAAKGAPIDLRLAGYTKALSEQAERGFQIFNAANCMECHVPPDFTDAAFHNTGVTFVTSGLNADDQGRIDVLPAGSPRTSETVRAWKTQTLREIQQTFPYMHNGALSTLEEVVKGYNTGWQRIVTDGRGRRYLGQDRFQDQRLRPLGLSLQQQEDLVVFLSEAFKSPNYPKISAPGLPR